ncbi:hypothetical protein AZL_010270 [Azospirillum sp. B510]|uniref:hypothetical protein n=1 Tax=Azospirillum sp. (strain B510) TaxID=137722 RepID=UPI0001C4BD94|nr:hypothetical protein [Azospirillum sp. B510]BAI71665.1 hypothetical protein AZL_010270 [Azospirillum sp. B510]
MCGYRFGDDHITQDIELALERPGNKSTLIAFCQEGAGMADRLSRWRMGSWGKKVFIAMEKGLHVGKEGPFHPSPSGGARLMTVLDAVNIRIGRGTPVPASTMIGHGACGRSGARRPPRPRSTMSRW